MGSDVSVLALYTFAVITVPAGQTGVVVVLGTKVTIQSCALTKIGVIVIGCHPNLADT
jgi:hypothetical protein